VKTHGGASLASPLLPHLPCINVDLAASSMSKKFFTPSIFDLPWISNGVKAYKHPEYLLFTINLNVMLLSRLVDDMDEKSARVRDFPILIPIVL
jgi:hypothetical protein